MRKQRKSRIPIIPLILGVVVAVAAYRFWQQQPGYDIEPGILAVEKAFYDQASDLMVEVDGRVARILKDHEQRDRYQEFVIRLSNGQSVLIVHDNTYAERVPISVGDTVLVRGNYRWSENGGSILFTYRDSSTRRRHGWIDHQGVRYE